MGHLTLVQFKCKACKIYTKRTWPGDSSTNYTRALAAWA